jgi:hypothetical protein
VPKHPLSAFEETQVRRILNELERVWRIANSLIPRTERVSCQVVLHWHTTAQRACSMDPEGLRSIGEGTLSQPDLRIAAEEIHEKWWRYPMSRHRILGLGFKIKMNDDTSVIILLPKIMRWGREDDDHEK